jgi:HlyD family secretion protein
MSTTATQPDQELARILGAESASNRRSKYVRWIAAALVLLAAIAGYRLLTSRSQNRLPLYETEPVTRATLRVTVSATGNLAPTNKIEIGCEQSGTIETVMVQENDRVTKGQVLARLDVSKLQDQITKSQAALSSYQAKLAQAETTLQLDQASLDRDKEVSRLSGGKVPSKTEMESAQATLDRAQADVLSARADLNQGRASLSSDQTNLSKASIRSPVNGVVLSRAAEPGQTVAAGLQVTTLFMVAEDLRQMDLKVDVDEADVGGVKDGQAATFTVDAYPGRKYSARVTRVAYGSTTKNNVVSYSTVLKVKNDDLSLRPGMTATAEIATVTRDNALLVPNAALRFTLATPAGAPPSGGLLDSLLPHPPADKSSQSAATKSKGSSQQVWALVDGKPLAIPVTVGVTDGRFTEITGGDLKEGMQVITDNASLPK